MPEVVTIKYPATKVVHWPTGPVNVCDKHAKQLIRLSRILGSHVGFTAALDGVECRNCIKKPGRR